MPYSDIAGIKRRMPGFFADQDTAFYSSYVQNLDDADMEAKSIIDSFLGAKYKTPFSDFLAEPPAPLCPGIIVTIAGLLTRSQFLLDQYLGDGQNAEPRQSKALYDRAMMLLEKIIKGEIVLDGVDLVANTHLGIYSSTYGKKSILYHFDFYHQVKPDLHYQLGRPNEIFRARVG